MFTSSPEIVQQDKSVFSEPKPVVDMMPTKPETENSRDPPRASESTKEVPFKFDRPKTPMEAPPSSIIQKEDSKDAVIASTDEDSA